MWHVTCHIICNLFFLSSKKLLENRNKNTFGFGTYFDVDGEPILSRKNLTIEQSVFH